MRNRRKALALLLGLAALIAAGPGTGAARAEAPHRIVSLTVCTDQLLLDLVPRDRIAALSYLAVDPTLSCEGRGGARPQGRARNGRGGAGAASPTSSSRRSIRRRRPSICCGAWAFASCWSRSPPTSMAMRRAIRVIAEAVGTQARGEAMIAAFDARLAAAAPQGPERPRALAYEVNSLASGRGSLVDAALRRPASTTWRATARSALAAACRWRRSSPIRPTCIVLANTPDEFRSTVGDNLRHPAFEALVQSRPHMQACRCRCGCARRRRSPAPSRSSASERRALLAGGGAS